ncbi:hypothetical protein K435DRAFT_971275 [Dendrothele bispora CBS 962.96]|uniref:G-protein coupled receptors family 2 profile 2 domain-containing protein n=1 Tax=Dendrothele bispora (strain CBS 962.96) TaxID=1314807 RepID=A0A4S8L747_DENBC|nr:hypothetical protein K435DRAFT_971275 [Dendrothele bispora CBS 962.96]
MNTLTRRDPTLADFIFAGQLGLYSTVPGTCLSFLVLVFYGLIALYPQGRKHLNRVSFRLLAYSLFFNILYGIASAVTAAQDEPSSLCTFGAFAVNFTLSFALFLTTCIAINLQLVLVHNVNGKKMEKYYIIGTTIFSIVLTVPAYGLGQYGFHQPTNTCWFKNPDPKQRLDWLIGTQSILMGLSPVIEIICSSVVLFWMFRFHMSIRYLQKSIFSGHTGSLAIDTVSGTTGGAKTSFWSGSHTVVRDLSSKYRGVIIRIALYPIVSLFINAPTATLNIYSVVVPVTTDSDYRLLVVNLVLYGLRTLLYAILASVDPSFIKAVREIKAKQKRSINDSGRSRGVPHIVFAVGGRAGRSQSDSVVTTMGGGPLTSSTVELPQVTQSDDMNIDTKTVKGGAQDHDSMFGLNQNLKQTTGLVNHTSDFLSSRTEAQTRSRFEIEQEWEEDRKFEQQL